ncbi:hypothetical protein UT300003_32730 [Clostridium sardiniense]
MYKTTCKGRGFNCNNCEKKFSCNEYKFNPILEEGIGIEKLSIQRIDYKGINERYKDYVKKNAEIRVDLNSELILVSNREKFKHISSFIKLIIDLYKRNIKLVCVLEEIEAKRDSIGATNEDIKLALSICNFREFDAIAFSLSEEE